MVRFKGYSFIVLSCLLVAYYQYNSLLNHQRHLKHLAFVHLAEVNEQKGIFDYPYSDQLAQLFGPLNAKLVKKHYQNFFEIKTDSQFYNFYANTITLQKTLSSTLEKQEQSLIDSIKSSSKFSWFVNASASLKLVETSQKLRVAIDFNFLERVAQKSEGLADDRFFSLYKRSYKDFYFPLWLKREDKKIFSKLGTGIHQKILKEVELEIESESYFKKEIGQIKRMVITDLLFSKNFKATKKDVLQELNNIYENYPFKEKEKEMISDKIKKISEADAAYSFKAQSENLISSVK